MCCPGGVSCAASIHPSLRSIFGSRGFHESEWLMGVGRSARFFSFNSTYESAGICLQNIEWDSGVEQTQFNLSAVVV